MQMISILVGLIVIIGADDSNVPAERLMIKILIGVMVLVVVLLTRGKTLASAKAGKGTGQSRTYDKPLDVVWEATVEVVKTSGLDLVSEDKGSGTILAQRGMSGFSYGENVAVFVAELDGKTSTRVEVVNKRNLWANFTAANWARRIFRHLDKKLGPVTLPVS
jgi:hypothetical protein